MTGHRAPPADGLREVSLVLLAAALLRNARSLIGIPVILIGMVAALHLLRPSSWIAQSSFMPESGAQEAGALMGLANQLSLTLGTAREAESLDFYVDLVASFSFLDSLAITQFPTSEAGSGGTGTEATLLDILGTPGGSQSKRLRHMRDRLRRDVVLQPLRRSGLLMATTRAPSPELAEAMNQRVLELIDAFNQTRRRSRASDESRFIETRLGVVRDSLAAAQAELIRFARNNRQPAATSPEVFVEQSRLEREVELLATLYSQLSQSYERARLEEVRNTPVITVIDSPQGTATREATLGRQLLIASVVGTLVALSLVFLREHVRLRLQLSEERAELLQAWRLSRPWPFRPTPDR